MEEEDNEIKDSEQPSEEDRKKVGFPQVPEKKSGFNFKLFIILLVLLLAVGGGAWYLFGRSGQEIASDNLSPTPSEEKVEEVTPTPTEADVDKDKIRVQILNGIGIPGAAGKLQTALEAKGYSNFKTGNAGNYSYKATEVTFDSSVPGSVKEEIMDELGKLYETVKESTGSLDDYDISIVVGFAKGYTPTPAPKSTLTPTPRPASTGTGTVTPTGGQTSTPTP